MDNPQSGVVELNLADGAQLLIYENFLSQEEANSLFEILKHKEGDGCWNQDVITVGGRQVSDFPLNFSVQTLLFNLLFFLFLFFFSFNI